ncbi:restriction endonuclease subunit S [Methylobacillus sp. Pita2]|uniref:restriction endonuclease subunit S n=1 Tax=Methylobacillus sp. Pita2 TaxID=3383245 RepID=UPI0038B48A88
MPELPKIDIRPDHWGIVCDILQKHVPQYAVWAFGSRAKWTAKEYSDLDLAVITDKPLSLDVSASLSDDFSESDLPWKVDIVDWASTSESFRKVIERDKVVVQEVRVDRKWIITTVGDYCPFTYGKAVKKNDQVTDGTPVYGSNGIFTFTNKPLVKQHAVIIGRKGSVGKVHFSTVPCWVSDTAFYVTKDSIQETYFSYYLLSSLGLEDMNTDAAVPGLNRDNAHRLDIKIPGTVEERVSLIEPLVIIDKKIDLNRRINQTLEAMAQAIFKSWFVDFDPVKAKIAAIEQGEDPLRAAMRAISGKTDAELDQMPREHHDQLAATAALFPDAMQESELGEIPKGWEVKRVGDLIELAYGKALKSTDRKQGSVPVYGSGGVTGYHNEALVPHGAIIVGRKGTVGSLYWEDDPFFPIDTTFYVKPKAVPITYCFYAMQTLGLNKMNTDAAVPGLNRENVYRLELVAPPALVLDAFDGLVEQMRKTMRANEITSQSLAELRDTLLPKLLSGELRVPDVEAAK